MSDERVILSDCFTCKELALVGLIMDSDDGAEVSRWPHGIHICCKDAKNNHKMNKIIKNEKNGKYSMNHLVCNITNSYNFGSMIARKILKKVLERLLSAVFYYF